MDKSQPHPLEWRTGNVPVSQQFDDPFFSLDNGLAETAHVFLRGNDLPERFCDGFHIAELGFGTGLNFLASLAAFRAAKIKGVLHFTSFEAFPLQSSDLIRAWGAYQTALPTDACAALTQSSELPQEVIGPDYILHLQFGDARATLPQWGEVADAWFLDGFSPAKNPELWEDHLMKAVAQHTKQGGTCATYTAAGAVRRALETAGFTVERVSGFGRKRHMTKGYKR
ncbi:tRNA (5-methylaminomethyl-2-thiouridine)(34)-methyltransferase MnmD [Rhodobacteraceae bacterium XHP0102]|nr:tRNA (5-methylaminomethyl-2-thiouridine)(34)-methyltransferase MnmD [Rhodobacteraceae bacterium XHP0102]